MLDSAEKMKIYGAIKELEEKKEQLKCLINFLREAGPSNPQHYQIKNCQDEFDLANSQINEFNEILNNENT